MSTPLWSLLRRAAVPAVLGLSLTACATTSRLPTIEGAGCQLAAEPEYAIQGKTTFDQAWIDDTEEAFIAACHWSRPKARPQQVAAMPVKAPLKVTPDLPPVSAVIAPPKAKKHWWQRLHLPKPKPKR